LYHGIGHVAIPRQELGMIEQSIRPTQQFTIVTRARHDYQLTELRTTAAFILEEEGAVKLFLSSTVARLHGFCFEMIRSENLDEYDVIRLDVLIRLDAIVSDVVS